MKYIGLNNKAVDAKDAVVSALDHGFLYGMGLFETFRTYGGSPFCCRGILTGWQRAAGGWVFPLRRMCSSCWNGFGL